LPAKVKTLRWAAGKPPDAWLFDAPEGGPLRESNWKRSVGWSAATSAVGVPGFRVHDLRHTAASVWLAAGVCALFVDPLDPMCQHRRYRQGPEVMVMAHD